MYNAMPSLSKFAVDPAAENSVVIPYDCVALCPAFMVVITLELLCIKNESGGVHVKC
jgi:hypothetical protein